LRASLINAGATSAGLSGSLYQALQNDTTQAANAEGDRVAGGGIVRQVAGDARFDAHHGRVRWPTYAKLAGDLRRDAKHSNLRHGRPHITPRCDALSRSATTPRDR
jgi:hypothetical protein